MAFNNTIIDGNYIFNNSEAGINLVEGDSMIVTGNIIDCNSAGLGITFMSSDKVIVTGNIIKNASTYGISFEAGNTDNFIITSNIILDSGTSAFNNVPSGAEVGHNLTSAAFEDHSGFTQLGRIVKKP